MRAILRKLAACLAIFAFLAPTALVAANPPNMLWSARNDGWAAIRTGEGCYLIYYKDMIVEGYDGYVAGDLEVVASAGCGADGLAEGPAVVEFVWTRPGDGRGMVHKVEGTAHGGVFQGDAQELDVVEVEGGYALMDVVPNPLNVKYRDGCLISYDPGDGRYVALDQPDGCDPSGIQPMIDQLGLARLLPEGSDGGTVPVVPQPAPAPAPTASAQLGDRFGECITLEDIENEGLYNDWALVNRCGRSLSVSFCLASDPPALSDYAQCSQGDFRTITIAANYSAAFSYDLTDWGHSELKSLQVQGYACEGGQPSVYFEDHRLKFTGC